MMKYLKILIFSMLIVGLTVGFAMAGAVSVNNGGANGIFRLSLETMGTNRNMTIAGVQGNDVFGAANFAVTYTVAQALVAGNLVKVQFSGASFQNVPYYICSNAAVNGTYLGQVTPAAGSVDENIQLAGPVLVGNWLFLTTGAVDAVGAGGCNSPTKINFAARTNTTSLPITPTITVGAYTTGLAPLDVGGAVNLANVQSEFTPTINAGAHIVDYLGLPGTGTRLLPGNVLYAATNGPGVGGPLGAANVIQTAGINYTVNGGPAGGAANAALTAGLAVSLTDTMSWQGLTKVFLVNGTNPGACTDNAAGNLVGTGTLSGTLTLNLPAGAFNGWRGIDVSVCAIAGGNVLSQPRAIQASVDINIGGSGAVDPSATPFNNVDVWTTNAYQGFIPWLVNNSLVPTYCLISNTDTARTATVLFEVVGSEGASVLSGTLGTLAPKTSILSTFTANSASIDGGSTISLATLGTDKRYVGKLTLTNNPNVVTVTCVQTDPATGVKRSVPVLTNSIWGQ